MAVSYIWPLSLPQKPNTNYSESGGVLIIRSPTDAGPAKQRRRGNKPQVLSMNFDMTDAQVLLDLVSLIQEQMLLLKLELFLLVMVNFTSYNICLRVIGQ